MNMYINKVMQNKYLTFLFFSIIIICNSCSDPTIDTPSSEDNKKKGIEDISDEVREELRILNNLSKEDLEDIVSSLNTAANKRIKGKSNIKIILKSNIDRAKKGNLKYQDFYIDLKQAVKRSNKDYENKEFIDAIKNDDKIPKAIKEDIINPFYTALEKENNEKSANLISNLKEYFPDIEKVKGNKDEWIESHLKNENKLLEPTTFKNLYKVLPTEYEKSLKVIYRHISKVDEVKKSKSDFVKIIDKDTDLNTEDLKKLLNILLNDLFNDEPDELFNRDKDKDKDDIKIKEDIIDFIDGKIKLKISYFNANEVLSKLEKIKDKIPASLEKIKARIEEILKLKGITEKLNTLENIPNNKFLPRDKEWLLYEITYYAQNLSSEEEIESTLTKLESLEIEDELKKEFKNILNEEKDYRVKRAKIIKEDIPKYVEPGGIPNQGNTCYAASLFQMLARSFAEPFYLYDLDLERKKKLFERIKKIKYKTRITITEDEIKSNENAKDIIEKCRQLIEKVRTGKDSEDIGVIINLLIKNGYFEGKISRQEDSDELLKAISKALPTNQGYFEVISQQEFNNNLISSKNQRENTLILKFIDLKGSSLEELLKLNFNQKAKIEKTHLINNIYRDSKVIEDTLLISNTMPKKLIISLARLDDFGRKINNQVKAPLELIIKKELTKEKTKDIKYKLTSFNVHSGTAGGGHYIAYIDNNGKWHKMSDGRKLSNPDNIENETGDGYLYCYEME